MQSLRRRLLGSPAIALHRLALALVRRLPPPRPRAGPPAIRIVLANAHAMGGTVRATLDLAEQLARHREVEVIALKRRGPRRPFFAFPDGVTVTTLDDRGRERGLRRAGAGRAPERARPSRGLRLPRREPVDRPAAAAAPPGHGRRRGAGHAARMGAARHRGGAARRGRRGAGAPQLPRPPAGAGRRRPPALPRARRARGPHRGRPRRLRAPRSARGADPEPDAGLARRALAARGAGDRGGRPPHLAEGLRPADRGLRADRAGAIRTGPCASTAAGPSARRCRRRSMRSASPGGSC